MAARFEVYKCDSCGNIVDASKEKHVPVVETSKDEILVKVGSVPHPMEKEHYIEWIELIKDGKTLSRQYLNPGETPEAKFKSEAKGVVVREYCNLHGLWKA